MRQGFLLAAVKSAVKAGWGGLLAALLVGALGPVSRAGAQVRDRRLEWHQIQTEHFEISYPEPLGMVARRAAAVCERAHARLTTVLGHPTGGPRIFVVITDETDSANGSATSLPYNQMRLFATAPEDISPLSDFDDWFNVLITHEHTHVLHLDTVGGLPAIVNRVLGKVWSPNLVQPRWFVEGLAVHEETRETSSGRLRSSMFEMFLRMDALEGRLLRLDQLSNSVDRWPRGNAQYLYGSHFVEWIAQRYGREVLTAMSHDYGRRPIPYGVNRAARNATGHTFVELYEDWQRDLRARQREVAAEIRSRGVVSGQPLTSHGDIARAPRWLDDDTLVYYALDGAHDAQLRQIDADGTHVRQLTRVAGDAYASPTPSGDLVYGALDGHRDIYFLYDLFRLDPESGETTRLTHGMRAREPDVSPDGRRVVFTINGANTTHLMIADLANVERTARVLLRSRRFEQVYTPRFSPDGRSVAISRWTHGGYRDIEVVDVETGEIDALMHDRAQDSGPAWSPDGRHLYFSSDRSGVANLYRQERASGEIVQVTNVISGAYSPDVSPDGRRLAYLGYSSFGWDIWTLDLTAASPRDALPYVDERPAPPPDENMVVASTRYRAWRTLWPRAYFLDVGADSFGTQIGLTLSQSDIADHYTYSARVGVSVPGGYTSVDGAVTFNRLPAPLRVGAFRRFSRRGGLQVGGEDRTWVEDAVGLDVSGAYGFRRALHSESISAGYSLSWLRQAEAYGGRLDPNTPPPVLPFTGRVTFLRVGWGYSDARSRIYDMFPTAGRALSLNLSIAHPVIGSGYRAVTLQWNWRRYIEAPWKHHHAFAFRYGGGLSGGDLGRRGLFAAGGFPGTTIVDGLIDNAILGGVGLRGYPAGSRVGTQLQLIQAEYRVPLLRIMRGYETLPAYLSRMHASVFVDVGDAFFGRIDPRELRVGVGAELYTDFVLGYVLSFKARLGLAYGFMEGGGLQGYFHLGLPF